MDRPIKIALGISALLLAVFLGFIISDYIHFQENLPRIAESLRSSDPAKLQASWFTVMLVRAIEFLVPSLIIGGGALIIHFRDNRKPKTKKR